MRRTMERSQRMDQRQKRWSWGGLSTDSEGRTGTDPLSRYSLVFASKVEKAKQMPAVLREPVLELLL